MKNPLDQVSVGKGRQPLKDRGRLVVEVQRYVMAFRSFPARPIDYRRKDTHDKGYLLGDRQGATYAEIALVQQGLYDEICETNGGTKWGCWDVWAWQGRKNLLVEAKMSRHDTINSNQVRWFKAATRRVGIPASSFAVAEWYLEAGA